MAEPAASPSHIRIPLRRRHPNLERPFLSCLWSKGDAVAKETGEALVKTMLFAGAVPLTAPIRGTSNFAADFAGQGPRDSRGRSLRDFDLQTRLFRYPLSYLVYSKSFDALPAGVKSYVYRRLREILSGEDKSKDFAYISATERTAILEILRATKPDFPS